MNSQNILFANSFKANKKYQMQGFTKIFCLQTTSNKMKKLNAKNSQHILFANNFKKKEKLPNAINSQTMFANNLKENQK